MYVLNSSCTAVSNLCVVVHWSSFGGLGHGTLQSHCARMRMASVPRLNNRLLPSLCSHVKTRLGRMFVAQGTEQRRGPRLRCYECPWTFRIRDDYTTMKQDLLWSDSFSEHPSSCIFTRYTSLAPVPDACLSCLVTLLKLASPALVCYKISLLNIHSNLGVGIPVVDLSWASLLYWMRFFGTAKWNVHGPSIPSIPPL